MKISRQSGLALVIVIWVLSLLTIMAGSFALTMRRETTVISAVKDNAVMLAAAESGVAIAQQMLLLEDENKRWRADGSVYSVQFQDAEIRVRLFSEQGKVDINEADEALLTALMNSTSIEFDKQQSLVGAIIDWRDSDDLVHINGAEKQQYEDAGLAYQPANKKFQLIDELQMVLGMNATVFQQLQPLITVYSGQRQVDFSVASQEVLLAISNLDSVVIDDYLQQRVENSLDEIPAPEYPQIENDSRKQVLDANGSYTIISQAKLYGVAGGKIKVTFKKTADERPGNAFDLLDWQHIYQELSLFSDEMTKQLIMPKDESKYQY